MKIILIGKGAILFNIAQLILNKKKGLDIVKIYWDSNNNSSSDLYYLKNLKNLKNNIKVQNLKNINLIKNINILKKKKFDYLLSINNTQIFENTFLNNFKDKIINYHYSLIPSYKGLHSCTKVILKQEKITGISWHYVTRNIDNGKVIFRKKIKIDTRDNAAQLISKLNNLCLKNFFNFLNNLKKNITLKNSANIKDFKLKLKSRKYSKISLNMNCKKIFSIFKAFSYYPFNSPLPRITIQLDKIREIKNISMSSSSRIHFKRYIKLDKKKFLIRSLDKKYIVVEIY